MLIEFSVENFLSFGELKTFSFVASAAKEHRDSHVFSYTYPEDTRAKEIPLLKSAVIYGANASGKSNLIEAINFMTSLIQNSSKESQISEDIPIRPFLLNTTKVDSPSVFEIIFIENGIRYRYGFRLNRKEILDEWLYQAPRGKEAYLFNREGNRIKINRFFRDGRGLKEKTRPNALFLSVCSQFNGQISTDIVNWFKKIPIISGIDIFPSLQHSLELFKNATFKQEVLKLLDTADLGISGFKLKEIDPPDDIIEFIKVIQKIKTSPSLNESSPEVSIQIDRNNLLVLHNVYNKDNQISGTVEFHFSDESSGTIRLISLAAPILYSLQSGRPLIIDELDARLHPLLTTFIISLFNSKENNPNNAQLLFTTHDTNLLSNKIFRRDQIWFTEKNRYGVSDLYSLADFRPVRKDAPFAKEYIQGKYGAIPFIGDIETMIGNLTHHD